jgi:hypothetical protein
MAWTLLLSQQFSNGQIQTDVLPVVYRIIKYNGQQSLNHS